MKAEGIEKTNLKLIMNGNYGKWGQREKFKEIYFENIPFHFLDQLKKQKIPYQMKMFNKTRNDCYIHIFAPVKVNNDYTNIEIDKGGFRSKIHSIPVFSSYITSHARVYLLENMIKYENKELTYVDTDCLTLEHEVFIPDSLELGAFKKEKEMIVEIFGNKNYTEMKNDETNRKLKGVPKNAILVGENQYQFNTMTKTKRALRQNKNAGVWESTTKNISLSYDKRIIHEDGKTSPIHIL